MSGETMSWLGGFLLGISSVLMFIALKYGRLPWQRSKPPLPMKPPVFSWELWQDKSTRFLFDQQVSFWQQLPTTMQVNDPRGGEAIKYMHHGCGVDSLWVPTRVQPYLQGLYIAHFHDLGGRPGWSPETKARAFWETRMLLQVYALGLAVAAKVYEDEKC